MSLKENESSTIKVYGGARILLNWYFFPSDDSPFIVEGISVMPTEDPVWKEPLHLI